MAKKQTEQQNSGNDQTVSPESNPVTTVTENTAANSPEKPSEDQTNTENGNLVEDQPIQENHNPYSNMNTVEGEEKGKESIEQLNPGEFESSYTEFSDENPNLEQSPTPNVQNEPIKPTLTDNVVYQDYSQASTVKVENAQGVTVKLSGTAAKILKNLDAKTKIVG